MPDLTRIPMQCCEGLQYQQTSIGGYRQEFRLGLGWACDCKGFQYRHTCKHVAAAESEQCTWCEQTGKAQTAAQRAGHVCPECGGATFVVMTAG